MSNLVLKVIDVGCGYGVPVAWLLAIYPDLTFLACEPNAERAGVTSRVLADRGRVVQCSAMDLPLENEKADAVLCLDMLHYFSDRKSGISESDPIGAFVRRKTDYSGNHSETRIPFFSIS